MVFLALLIDLSHAKSHAFVYAIFSEVVPASCQRSIFTLAMSMLAFAGKVCHITELSDLLRCFSSSQVSSGAENNKILCPFHTKYFMLYLLDGFFHVPSYLIAASASVILSKYSIGFSCMISENVLLNAMQMDPYLRIGDDLQLYVRLQSDLGSYGSESDQEVAKSMLSDCRTKVGINDQRVLDVIASALSNFIEVSLLPGLCDVAIFCCWHCMLL
jgi:hypothetical protein